jgi:hypothetical protein
MNTQRSEARKRPTNRDRLPRTKTGPRGPRARPSRRRVVGNEIPPHAIRAVTRRGRVVRPAEYTPDEDVLVEG